VADAERQHDLGQAPEQRQESHPEQDQVVRWARAYTRSDPERIPAPLDGYQQLRQWAGRWLSSSVMSCRTAVSSGEPWQTARPHLGLGSHCGQPAHELLRGADIITQHGGVDLPATHLIGVAREPVPHVLDPQHGQPLLVGDGVAQLGMPVGDMSMQVTEPHRQVDAPAPLPDV
jgi:hypothetical protein